VKKKREQEEAAKKKQEDDKRRREEDARKREAEKARAEAAARKQSEVEKYIEQIRNRIRSKANVPDTVAGNPEVQVRLRILPGGEVLEAPSRVRAGIVRMMPPSKGRSAARRPCRFRPRIRNFSLNSATLSSISGMNASRGTPRKQHEAFPPAGRSPPRRVHGARAAHVRHHHQRRAADPDRRDADGGESRQPQSVSEVVAADLSRSGLFKMVNTGGITPLPSEPPRSTSRLDVTGRRSAGHRQDRAAGRRTRRGALRLFDVQKSAQLASYSYVVAPAQLRATGHRIADVIYERLTGTRAFSRPRSPTS
jgi:hypothetical protein